MKKTIFLLLGGALLLCLPFFLTIQQTFPRLDSDYDAVIPIYQYMGHYIRTYYTFPTSIPFVSTGIPIVGDPVNPIFDPFFILPFIFFDANVAIRIAVLINAFLSGLAMFFLLKNFKVSKFLQYAGALLYMSAGSFISSVAAGHITEKFLVYPLYPLFFMMVLQKKLIVKKIIGAGILLGATVYCGDVYAAWFLTLLLIVIRGYYFFSSKEKLGEVFMTCCVGGIALLFASPRLYFFIKDVLPILKRANTVSPFLGSIQFFLFPFQFLMPLQVNFYDRPFFQRNLGFYFNWYEYYAFIGLLPALFIKNIKQLLKNDIVKICLLLLVVGSLYVANAYWYSPFHYLFLFIKPLDVFRVPQRLGIPLTSIVIFLLCLCANTWKNKKTLYLLWIGGLMWTYSVAWFTFSYTFVPIPKEKVAFAKEVGKINRSDSPVVNLGGASQYLLTQEGIPIINYYYAWVPKNTPTLISNKGIPYVDRVIKIHPLYILSPQTMRFEEWGYSEVYTNNTHSIWKKIK